MLYTKRAFEQTKLYSNNEEQCFFGVTDMPCSMLRGSSGVQWCR